MACVIYLHYMFRAALRAKGAKVVQDERKNKFTCLFPSPNLPSYHKGRIKVVQKNELLAKLAVN